LSKQTAASVRLVDQAQTFISTSRILVIFFTKADFLNADEIYEDILDFPKFKQHMEKTLVDYNEYPGQVPMDLVLFRDAIEHGSFGRYTFQMF
jgi:hypothetical protein